MPSNVGQAVSDAGGLRNVYGGLITNIDWSDLQAALAYLLV